MGSVLVERELVKHNSSLTLKQFVLLHKVSEQVRCQAELALITNRDKGSLTRLIQSLEKKKLIVRRTSEADARINIVDATPEGLKAMKEARKIVLGTFDSFTIDLDEKEAKALSLSLDKVLARITNTLKDSKDS